MKIHTLLNKLIRRLHPQAFDTDDELRTENEALTIALDTEDELRTENEALTIELDRERRAYLELESGLFVVRDAIGVAMKTPLYRALNVASRQDTARFVEQQLANESPIHKEKYECSEHLRYGYMELCELLDFIYGGEPENELEALHVEGKRK